MIPETRPGSAPGPVRLTLGIVLMVTIAMWAFAVPGALAAPATAEAVASESLQDLDAATDEVGNCFEVHDSGPTSLDLNAEAMQASRSTW